MPGSMHLAESIYQEVSLVVHVKSPGQIVIGDDGVPVVDYGYKNGQHLGKQSNPLAVASTAQQHMANYINSNDSRYLEKFWNCIRWLVDQKEDFGSHYMWGYNFQSTAYGDRQPWYSSLAQIHILLAFEQARGMDSDLITDEIIEKTLKAFEIPIADNGLMWFEEKGYGQWYAEYVVLGRASPPFILNGHMEVLILLHGFHERTGSEAAKRLFDKGVIGLLPHLGEYDTGKWTYYDREGNFAYDYHYTHLEELKTLHNLTGNPIFLDYYNKWKSYFPINPLWARKRFAAYLLVSVLFFVVATSLYTCFRLWMRRLVK